MEDWKVFYSTLRVLHCPLKMPSKKAEMVTNPANGVDMDLFWEGWLENDRRESGRLKELAHLVVRAWPQARLCGEFLQSGYNLRAFAQGLPDDPRSPGMATRFAEQMILE